MTEIRGHLIEITDWSPPLKGAGGYARMTHQTWPGFRFVVSFDAEATVTGFTIERDKDSPTISARALQRIPYGALERQALGRATSWIISYAEGISPAHAGTGTGSGLDLAAKAFAENQFPGAKGRQLAYYAVVASRYVELVKAGSSSPRKDLAQEMNISENKARHLIEAIRDNLLLTKPKKGLAGGELTKKALDLLRHDEGSK